MAAIILEQLRIGSRPHTTALCFAGALKLHTGLGGKRGAGVLGYGCGVPRYGVPGCGKRGVWWKTQVWWKTRGLHGGKHGVSGKHGGNIIFLTQMRSLNFVVLNCNENQIPLLGVQHVFRSKKQIKEVILHMICFLHRSAIYADLQICKDKTFGKLNQVFYLQVSWLSRGYRKKYHCMILRAEGRLSKSPFR